MSEVFVETLTACPDGHAIAYPGHLEQAAIDLDTDLAFYTACSCSTVIAVAWMGDRIRVMASGAPWLAEELEAMDWPELDVGDPRVGPFMVRKMPGAGWNLLDRRIRERPRDEEEKRPTDR